MATVFKWLGIIVGALIIIILIFAGFVYFKSNSILSTDYSSIKGLKIYVPDDSATVAHGKHIAQAWTGCVVCHGDNLGGMKIIDAMPFARVYGPNLTRGDGGLPADYTIEDFDRAVRHGVNRDGLGIWIMPSFHYCYLNDDDVAALFAYVKNLKPVNKTVPKFQLGPIGRMVLTMGGFPRASGEYVNHDKSPPAKPEAGATRKWGEYLARVSCMGCHAPNFSGGPIMGGDPKWPPAANITMGGKLQLYKSYEDLETLLREGERPDGSMVDDAMPVQSLADLTDEEISALWEYFRTYPRQLDSSATWWDSKAPF